MPADEEDFNELDPHDDFVPAVFARHRRDAERYREILEDHDIPVVMGDNQGRRGTPHGVPVLVPEPLLDEASEIIADLEDNQGFEDLEDVDSLDEDDEEDMDLDDGFEELEDEDDLALDDEEYDAGEEDDFDGLDEDEDEDY